jgi:AraC-like DNA-binding protein
MIEICEIISNEQLEKLENISDELAKIHDAFSSYLSEDIGRFYNKYSNMCRLGSYFSYLVLKEKFPEYDFQIDGGWHKDYSDKPSLDYLDKNNLPGGTFSEVTQEYESHYWCVSNKYGFIVDFTSQQFGYSEIYITDICDDTYRSNLRKDLLKEEVATAYEVLQHPLKKNNTYDNLTEREKFFVVINDIFKKYNGLKNDKNLDEIKANILNKIMDKKYLPPKP